MIVYRSFVLLACLRLIIKALNENNQNLFKICHSLSNRLSHRSPHPTPPSDIDTPSPLDLRPTSRNPTTPVTHRHTPSPPPTHTHTHTLIHYTWIYIYSKVSFLYWGMNWRSMYYCTVNCIWEVDSCVYHNESTPVLEIVSGQTIVWVDSWWKSRTCMCIGSKLRNSAIVFIFGIWVHVPV